MDNCKITTLVLPSLLLNDRVIVTIPTQNHDSIKQDKMIIIIGNVFTVDTAELD